MSRIRFDRFELDVTAGELRSGGAVVKLQPQPCKVLALLASRAGQLVTRAEIQRQVWTDDTFVDFEQGLNYCVRQIRAALDDQAETPRFIETVPRRGYRFLAPVTAAASAPQAPSRVMLAVLPFENLSGIDNDEYFSDGLTDEMIAQLGRINPQTLGVIARTSAMRYKGTDKSIGAIGSELGVGFVLEGSVRRNATRVRVTAQLIQVCDQSLVWADTYERHVGDVLSLQRDVARAIAGAIQIQLTPQEQQRLASLRPIDSRAYEAYLQGRFAWNQRTRQSLERSVRCFLQAIEIDPEYAAAHAGIADAYMTQLDYNYLLPREAFSLVNRAVLEAIRLEDSLAEPHTSLGHLRLHEFNWRAAEQEFIRAIALNPGYSTAHYYYGNLLAALGRYDEAIDEAQRSLDLDPLSLNARQNRMFLYYLARRYDEALNQADEILQIDPRFLGLYYTLGLVQDRLGRFEEATRSFEVVSPAGIRRGSTVAAAAAVVVARAGRRDDARATLQRLEGMKADEYVSSYDLALVSLAVDDVDKALAHLSNAIEDHASFVPYINIDARLDPLRTDPRFAAIIERLKFPRT